MVTALIAASPADPALVAAERAYAGHDYERVVPLASRALGHGLTLSERRRALELVALTYAAFDDSPRAIAGFEQLLHLDPTYQPVHVSPKISGLYEEARRKVPRPFIPLAAVRPPPLPPPVVIETPLGRRWWFWTAVGVVVAGGAGTALALTAPRTPHGTLPNGSLQ